MLKDLSRSQDVMLHLITALLILTCNAYGGKSPTSFADDGIGVSFLGFNARAGIGGNGKLHASAGTPWGAHAGAGIEAMNAPSVAESSGGLYAGATAGGGISASASLVGDISKGRFHQGSFADSSSGEKLAEVINEKSSGVTYGGIRADYKSHQSTPVSKHVQVIKNPVELGVVEVVHKAHPVIPPPQSPPEIKPVTTVIQKTVIPNYEKKTVKVPSYEERVIRVPTVVEKEVWVPAPPTIIEKEVKVEHPVPSPPPSPTYVQTFETVPVVYKTRFRKRPFLRKHFFLGSDYSTGYNGGYAAQYSGEAGGSAEGSYTTTLTKTAKPQLFSDIINIPVSTLGAVNKLLSNVASGVSAGGSFELSKSVSSSKFVGAGGYPSTYH